jgi:DNA-3-methyladenine glycosylase I
MELIKMKRCSWCQNDELYIKYHDEEWGVPVHNDKKHFEFLILEGVQAGLNWLMVLKKRENYRKAFDNFDPLKIAQYNQRKVSELMNNPGIIRNKRKIEASIVNANNFIRIQEEFGSFDEYIWNFVDYKPIVNYWREISEIPSKTKLSDKISKDLKSRGFKFVGSTIIYSHLQAIGIINDHVMDCFRFTQLAQI